MKYFEMFKEYYLSPNRIGKGDTIVAIGAVQTHNGETPIQQTEGFVRNRPARLWTRGGRESDRCASIAPMTAENLKGLDYILVPDNSLIIAMLLEVDKEIANLQITRRQLEEWLQYCNFEKQALAQQVKKLKQELGQERDRRLTPLRSLLCRILKKENE